MRDHATRIAVLVSILVAGGIANAQGGDSAAALSLFQEGQRLAQEEKWSEACPKFAASLRLDVKLGTLLNLANCLEKTNQLASAWARFTEGEGMARRAGQAEREEYAREHATALAPRLSKLAVKVNAPLAGLVVKRDGVVVDPNVYGVEIAVDGGTHTIEASAPSKKPFTTSVTIANEKDKKVVEIPALAAAPAEPVVVTPATALPRDEDPGKGRKIAGLALGGAGLLAIGVGSYFGITALGKNSDAEPYCNVNGVKDDCYGAGVALRRDAVNSGNLSTIFIATGALLVAGGLVLYLTAPRAKVGVGIRDLTFSLFGRF